MCLVCQSVHSARTTERLHRETLTAATAATTVSLRVRFCPTVPQKRVLQSRSYQTGKSFKTNKASDHFKIKRHVPAPKLSRHLSKQTENNVFRQLRLKMHKNSLNFLDLYNFKYWKYSWQSAVYISYPQVSAQVESRNKVFYFEMIGCFVCFEAFSCLVRSALQNVFLR